MGDTEKSREFVIQKFRTLINEFKSAILDWLEESEGDTDATQDVSRISVSIDNEHQLYKILKAALDAGGVNKREDIPAKSVCSVFEKEGILPAYRSDPAIRDSLNHYLELDLLVYPLTRKPKHIENAELSERPSYQDKIIPNEEQDDESQVR